MSCVTRKYVVRCKGPTDEKAAEERFHTGPRAGAAGKEEKKLRWWIMQEIFGRFRGQSKLEWGHVRRVKGRESGARIGGNDDSKTLQRKRENLVNIAVRSDCTYPISVYKCDPMIPTYPAFWVPEDNQSREAWALHTLRGTFPER